MELSRRPLSSDFIQANEHLRRVVDTLRRTTNAQAACLLKPTGQSLLESSSVRVVVTPFPGRLGAVDMVTTIELVQMQREHQMRSLRIYQGHRCKIEAPAVADSRLVRLVLERLGRDSYVEKAWIHANRGRRSGSR